MPYLNEQASKLGHVPTVNSQAVRDAMQQWTVSAGRPDNPTVIGDLCCPLDDLEQQEGDAADINFSITVDGSDAEVEATRDHPTVKVGYLRVAGSMVDLKKFQQLGEDDLVDPQLMRKAHSEYAFDAALPGAGLVRDAMNGRDTWRYELNEFFRTARFDSNTEMTLADGMMSIHGAPLNPASTLPLRVCPSCGYRTRTTHGDLVATVAGSTCPACHEAVYVTDVLRLHEEYNEEGSNFSPITRAMNAAERLMTACYMEYFFRDSPEVLGHTLFVTDGPLALHGPVAPQSRAFLSYLQAMSVALKPMGVAGPLLVGVEKSGTFVEHAEIIKEFIPPGHVMRLTNDYINRITARPADNQYGEDEFYGRRFIYRATNGDALVITCVPRDGLAPYQAGTQSEAFSSYPYLRVVCQVLDALRTRMYHNAVIPVALAHSSASLPLGVGRSVLTMMAQQNVPGLSADHQAVKKPTYMQGF